MGDGLCCTDVHLLGPVSKTEAEAIQEIDPQAIVRFVGLRLLSTAGGQCGFLGDDGRCGIYEHDEGRTKPRTCHRYPYLLVATPDGGRVGTDHRCPCRSLGDRPLLTPEAAEDPLSSAKGRLTVDRRIGARIAITPKQRVGWKKYLSIETPILEALEAGGRAEDALGVQPFPELSDMSWEQIATDLALDMPPTKWGWAQRTFSVFLAARFVGSPANAAYRPWTTIFDRAEARTKIPGDPEAMLRDFAADAIWSLEWAWRGSFLHARVEIASRIAIIRDMAKHFVQHGARPDRAMAEALSIGEIAGVSDSWSVVVDRKILS